MKILDVYKLPVYFYYRENNDTSLAKTKTQVFFNSSDCDQRNFLQKMVLDDTFKIAFDFYQAFNDCTSATNEQVIDWLMSQYNPLGKYKKNKIFTLAVLTEIFSLITNLCSKREIDAYFNYIRTYVRDNSTYYSVQSSFKRYDYTKLNTISNIVKYCLDHKNLALHIAMDFSLNYAEQENCINPKCPIRKDGFIDLSDISEKLIISSSLIDKYKKYRHYILQANYIMRQQSISFNAALKQCKNIAVRLPTMEEAFNILYNNIDHPLCLVNETLPLYEIDKLPAFIEQL